MAHYYTNDQVKSDPTAFIFNYCGFSVYFESDAGVFSKNFIDYGSQALLNAIEIHDNQKVLDVGCGYGAMCVSLAVIHKIEIHGIDVNLRAMELCKRNFEKNHISNYRIYESNCYENVNETFDVILTNPPIRAGKDIVTRILTEAYDHLNPDGTLWVVIQKKQGAPSAKKNMEEKFGNCTIVKRDKGYYILKSIKEEQ